MFTPYTPNAQLHLDRQRRAQVVWMGILLVLTVLIGVMMVRGEPSWANLGWLFYIAGVILILTNPRYGLYLVLFFTLCGDSLVWFWYPFTKNLSSAESLFFTSTSLKVSPLEIYLALITLTMVIQGVLRRRQFLRLGPLGIPIGYFGLMLVFGLVYGIAGHGNFTIALWEVRSMLYLVLMYFLVVSLVDDRRQLSILMWCIILGILVKGLAALYFLFGVLGGDLHGRESIMEHGASIHMDLLFVFALAVFLYRGSLSKRLLLPLMVLPTAVSYLANQRRASFVSLAIALMLMAVALFRHNRRAFWMIVPAAGVFGVLYIGATWNAHGVLALPARGVKSVIAPDPRDEASNEYRIIENINTNFTIHQKSLTGVGFGQKFYVLVPLPDISFFLAT